MDIQVELQDSDQEIQMSIAHKMAENANSAGIVIYSQWLPGKENIVYNCLLHDHNMSDPNLIHMICLFIPEQIAVDFTINHLPSKTISFVFSLVLKMPEMAPSPKGQPTTPSDAGQDGSSYMNKSESPFVKPCAKEPSQQDVSQNSSRDAQSRCGPHGTVRPSYGQT
jgi:hypothetical protein